MQLEIKTEGVDFVVSRVPQPKNDNDGVLSAIKDPEAKKSVIIPFAPLKDSRIGELTAQFDIVLGFTPAA